MAKSKDLMVPFDFDLEVVETKALMDRWANTYMTMEKVDAELRYRLWTAHQALGGSDKPGTKKSNVRGRTLNVRDRTITDYIKSIEMSRSTFYDSIKKTREMIEGGAMVDPTARTILLIEDLTNKSPAHLELEELVSQQAEDLANRETAIKSFKKDVKSAQKKTAAAMKTIDEMKATAEGKSEPDPELTKEIERLKRQQENLSKEVEWYTATSSFKAEMSVLLDHMKEVHDLGRRVLRSKKPKK